VRKMMMEIGIMAMLSLLMAAKKKPVFGQLTLTGEMALDWLKDGSEIIAQKIMFGPIGAFPEYNVPEWAQDRCSVIAIMEHADGFSNAMLVSQGGVLKTLERLCVDWEAQGAKAYVEGKAHSARSVIEFEENQPKITFTRDESKGKFAPYEVKIES